MEDGKNAYVTFIMKNDSFIPGALVLAYCLRKQCTKADLVCLITKDVSFKGRQGLANLYDKVIEVEEIVINSSKQHERQDWSCLFTRLQALRLGRDGDLGCSYDKIVLLDADIMPMKSYDELFELNTPAGIINERKEHFVQSKSICREKGKSIWHDIYESICCHGESIPKHLTDRVWYDSTNMGVNACVWVLKPSIIEYKSIIKSLKNTSIIQKISDFSWPEMQYMTYYWSGKWHNIDIRYCAFNSQPSIEHIYGTHFAGLKPWNDNKEKAVIHYYKFKDYRLWYREFVEMVKYVYPSLQDIPKVKRSLRLYDKKLCKIL